MHCADDIRLRFCLPRLRFGLLVKLVERLNRMVFCACGPLQLLDLGIELLYCDLQFQHVIALVEPLGLGVIFCDKAFVKLGGFSKLCGFVSF